MEHRCGYGVATAARSPASFSRTYPTELDNSATRQTTPSRESAAATRPAPRNVGLALAGDAAPQTGGPGCLQLGLRPPRRNPDHARIEQLEPGEEARHTRPVAHRRLLRHGLVQPPHHFALLLGVDVAAHVRDHHEAARYARIHQPLTIA